MICASYFDDGYTRAGFIAPVPMLHAGMRFVFRPARVEQRSRLNAAARRLPAHRYDRRVAAFAACQLVAWDVTDGRGHPVPISPAALLRLHPELFVRLTRIVLGWIAADEDPQWAREPELREPANPGTTPALSTSAQSSLAI